MNTFILCKWTHNGNGIYIISVSQSLEQIKKDAEIEGFDIPSIKNEFMIEEWQMLPEPERKRIYYHADFTALFSGKLHDNS